MRSQIRGLRFWKAIIDFQDTRWDVGSRTFYGVTKRNFMFSSAVGKVVRENHLKPNLTLIPTMFSSPVLLGTARCFNPNDVLQ